ncbi:MAG TPA: tetratricopeptide repeat protein [Candidatus Goldiibacteriota bacterium]|nr:tetratricopeptide repeat protein [Candidatus Goldiibacteriota bacterium]
MSVVLPVLAVSVAYAVNENSVQKASSKQQFDLAAKAMKAGMILEKAGEYKKAFREYSKIIDAKINYPQVHKRLAACYMAFKQYDYAVIHYKKYLEAFPDDKEAAEFAANLEKKVKEKEQKRLSMNTTGAEFKSPLSALMFSNIGLLPPAFLFQGYGSVYARNRSQSWFPVSSSMAVLAGFLLAADWGIRANNVQGIEPLFSSTQSFSAFLYSSAILLDAIPAPFIATESSLEFLYFAKNNSMKLEEAQVEYRDPAFTAFVSMAGGSVVPGAGHFFAGDTDTGFKLLILTPILAGGTMITGMALAGNDDPGMKTAGNITFYSGLGIYFVCRMIDLYGSLTHTDRVNEEYYKQLLCPNSPRRIKERLPEKEPLLAFAASLIPVPGTGNFYAENYWTAATLAGAGAAGAITYFAASGSDPASVYTRYAGLGLLVLAKLYDIASAPGYTAIWNAVHTGRQERERGEDKAVFTPLVSSDAFGLRAGWEF